MSNILTLTLKWGTETCSSSRKLKKVKTYYFTSESANAATHKHNDELRPLRLPPGWPNPHVY